MTSGNKLLASLSPEEYERIGQHLRSVPMKLKQTLCKQDEPIRDVMFPNGGACSLVKTLQNGQAAEVGTIGAEGVVGASVFFGQRVAECDVVVQLPGPGAQVMPADVFNAEMDRRGAFFNHIIRYTQALMSQIMQTTACNGLHSAEERCCRWLLMTHDRAGQDELALTHDFLALMLGVRRPTVTLVVASLQSAGLIESRRGSIRIIDRLGLETASCECYHVVRATWRRLLPELDRGIA
jgi:CRP-like cAMP-binding protein